MAERSLRVLHVLASRQRRGAEIFASDLTSRLAGEGVDQQVVVLRDHDSHIMPFNAPTSVLGARTWGPLRIDPLAIRRLRALAQSWSPDVLQAHGGEALKYVVPAALGLRTAIVYRRIGSNTGGSLSGLRLSAHARLMRRAAAVIAVSDAARSEMVRRFGVDQEKVVTIPNAVDISRAQPSRPRPDVRRVLGIAEDTEVVVSAGALNWEKDPIAQIEVFERVARKRPRSMLAMIGSGSLEGDTRRAAMQKGLEHRVLFLGQRDDVADILGASDVLMLASRTEGMPGVVIEAGIARLPVAAYMLSGVPEVVVAGSTGLLAPAGEVERLADCIAELLADPALRRTMGRAAHERCTNTFSIAPVASRYLDVYRQLLGEMESPISLEAAK